MVAGFGDQLVDGIDEQKNNLKNNIIFQSYLYSPSTLAGQRESKP
jgi:hypothetical protein